jgi:hypothetical protein
MPKYEVKSEESKKSTRKEQEYKKDKKKPKKWIKGAFIVSRPRFPNF